MARGVQAKARAQTVMFERVIDSAVLRLFSILYSCAVLLLKFRRKFPTQQRLNGKGMA